MVREVPAESGVSADQEGRNMENQEQAKVVGGAGIDRRDFLKGCSCKWGRGLAARGPGCARKGQCETTADDLAATGTVGRANGAPSTRTESSPSFLGRSEPIPDDAIVEEFDAEIVVVGFGLTGCPRPAGHKVPQTCSSSRRAIPTTCTRISSTINAQAQ